MGKQKDSDFSAALIGRILQKREVSLLLIIVILCVVLSLTTSNFAKPGNFRVLLQGMSTDMMIAIPMGIALIAGIFDISVGSTLCLASVLGTLAMNNGVPAPLSVLIGLLAGVLLGGFNAVLVTKLELPPMVATMGTWMAYRPIAMVILGGSALSRFPSSFLNLGRADLFGIPISIIYMVIIVLLGLFALKYITFFHNAYYIGANKQSATLAGINCSKFYFFALMLNGAVSAFAGLVLAARLGSATQVAGTGLEFRVAAGLLVGGISMKGGEGTLVGMILGVLLMQLVGNAIVLLHLNPSLTQAINGFILIAAIAIDTQLKQKSTKIS